MIGRTKISEVFKSIGLPGVTYVNRDKGKLEAALRNAIGEAGQLCLVTGPSKTGKTTLYMEVLSGLRLVPLVVPCDKTTTCADIWKRALEAVDFDRVESRSESKTAKLGAEAEISGKLGWNWLAESAARLKGTISRDTVESEVRKVILADPGPDLLVPILKETTYILVIEDFHYLSDDQKVILFQQWKRFIDNEVSVLVLGTTHRAVDIANSNKDLIGRISQIDVGHWGKDDLSAICKKGMEYIGTELNSSLLDIISTEAVGLPIIVQQACYAITTMHGAIYTDEVSKAFFKNVSRDDIDKCLNNVARSKYTQFESYYNTLVRGPREKARKYKTYELVIACFTLDPIQFSIEKNEIDQRLGRLVKDKGKMPPAASINSTLGALKNFQERREFTLLEWIQSEEVLYIVEPSFLFYVRWRTLKETSIQLDLFEELLRGNQLQ